MKNKLTEAENFIQLQKDKTLVRRSLRNNSEAFAELVAMNKKRVEAVGRKFFNDITDIEDFVQDVFIKAFKNLSDTENNIFQLRVRNKTHYIPIVGRFLKHSLDFRKTVL